MRDAAAAYDPLSSHGIGSAMGSGFYGGQAIADLLAGREEARWAYLDVMQNAYGAYLDLQRRCVPVQGFRQSRSAGLPQYLQK